MKKLQNGLARMFNKSTAIYEQNSRELENLNNSYNVIIIKVIMTKNKNA